MLCVPLFYQKGWTAQIDGEDAGVYNINEGMCGSWKFRLELMRLYLNMKHHTKTMAWE